MKKVKWTFEACKKSASSYSTITNWEREVRGAVVIARRNKWMSDCTAHMKSGYKKPKYWTFKKCKASAEPHNSVKEWRNYSKESERAFQAAKRNDWLDDCIAHMESGYKKQKKWTLEDCKVSAKLHNSVEGWRNHSKESERAYRAAKYNSWLSDCCAHMSEIEIKELTLEDCKKIAKNYKNRNAWLKSEDKSDRIAYYHAKRKGWLDECKPSSRPTGLISDLTLSECKAIADIYESRWKWRISKVVKHRLAYYHADKKGWLDKCKPKLKRKHSLEECKKIAQAFSIRTEWAKKDASSFAAAYRNNWMEDCCEHMLVDKIRGLTIDDCKEIGQKYNTRAAWLSSKDSFHRSAYRIASKNNWLDTCLPLKTEEAFVKERRDAVLASLQGYRSYSLWRRKNKKEAAWAYNLKIISECQVIIENNRLNQ